MPPNRSDVGKRVKWRYCGTEKEGTLIYTDGDSYHCVQRHDKEGWELTAGSFGCERLEAAGIKPGTQNLYWVDSYEVISCSMNSGDILDFYTSSALTPDERILRELGIEDPVGSPTDLGLKLSELITYRANKAEILKIAKQMKADSEAKKPKKESK